MDSKREEERNEKIIRGMMKLPPNRRCINCNSLGPQYVCTNFWTFVCMPCSGIHREFTHRVKSVSMAKFTSQEVDALQKGGNQRARELFLSAWDPLRHRHPDNSNADKVREFIKNVYVDKKYAGKKPSDRPPTDSQGLKSHEDEMRRASSYHSYSQSPPYDFQYEERLYGKHALSLNRKPGSDRGLYGGKVSSFSSFSSPSRFSDHANDIQSPSSQRETWSPFSETLSSFSNDVHGHHAVPNSDANGGSNTGIIRHPQRTASSGSFGSFDSMSFKSVNSTGSQELAAEAKRSVDTSRDNIPSSHTPSPPQSSTSATFNGLDLFNEPFAPQNHTSSPTTVCSPQAQSVDLFQQSHISSVSALVEQKSSHAPSSPLNFTGLSQQLLVASTIGEASDVARPQNGGWASFDIFQNSLPMESQNSVSAAIPSSDGIYLGDSNPFLLGQSSFTQKSTSLEPSASAHTLWHEGEPTTNNSQLWNAFKDSPGKQPTENVLKDRDLVEALHNGGNLETPYVSEPISSSLSSHLSSVFHNFSMIPEVAGAYPVAAAHRTTNPFDLPYDAGLEPSSMSQFWDISSLQVALPNNQMQAIYVGDTNDSWFSQNSVSPYIPSGVTFDPPNGSLGFLVGQVPSAQISSAQSCVASVGGNPFA